MINYPLDIDQQNFEIFPSQIWKNTLIAFHGTSEFHSDQIENNGFIPGYSPFEISEAQILIDMLKKLGITEMFSPWPRLTLQGRIAHYLENLSNLKLSLTPVSGASLDFAIGTAKGGQIFVGITDAVNFIKDHLTDQSSISSADKALISEQLNSVEAIIQLPNEITKANGVVYAVEFDKNLLNNTTIKSDNIYVSKIISPSHIIGKVIIPNTYPNPNFDKNQVKSKIVQKLRTRGSIGEIVITRENYGDMPQS